MLIAAWLLLLALLTWLFSDWLQGQHNPNQEVVSRLDASGAATVALLRNRQGHYVASGSIDGFPVELIVDTGASSVSIPGAVARSLGLRQGAPQTAVTASGVVQTYATRLDTVTLGDIVLHDVAATINPYMPGTDVLLGMSFLKQVELAQRGNTLTLRQYPAERQ